MLCTLSHVIIIIIFAKACGTWGSPHFAYFRMAQASAQISFDASSASYASSLLFGKHRSHRISHFFVTCAQSQTITKWQQVQAIQDDVDSLRPYYTLLLSTGSGCTWRDLHSRGWALLDRRRDRACTSLKLGMFQQLALLTKLSMAWKVQERTWTMDLSFPLPWWQTVQHPRW